MANKNGFKIDIIKNNADAVLQALEAQVDTGLTACGLMAEGYAMDKITENGTIDTGALKNSITHTVKNEHSKHKVIVGTNMEYAVYIEYGTGIHSTKGGRKSPWWWKGESKKWFGWHLTHGMKPKPFLKPALADHKEKYIEALIKYLKA